MSIPVPRVEQPVGRREATFAERAHEELRRALGRPRGAGELLVVNVPAPVAPVTALFDVLPGEPAVLWAPPEGPAVVGLGAALTVDLAGEARFAELRKEAERVFGRLVVLGPAEAPRPHLYGGLAFAPGAAAGTAWREFSDGRFVLPRWRYLCERDRAWLSLTLDEDADAAALPAELDRWLGRLASAASAAGATDEGAGAAGSPWSGPAIWQEQVSEEEWRRLIDEVRGLIAGGRCSKIVAARCARVRAGRAFQPREVLARLGASQSRCTRFAFRVRETTFLGATPERLVVRRGTRLLSEALAGSIAAAAPRGGSAETLATPDKHLAAELLASDKDRREHQLVVQAIVRALEPHCAWLDVPATPQVRALRHVLHLHTPIMGELADRAHVLTLVEALHPTPAVGGEPTRAALEWILGREPAPRGWYAAPVGWFDAAGDGEFAVALRCGVLDGSEATIYAGAGIMLDSDAAAEYRETAVKQRALAAALGVEP
ncbi:MAG TPA: isochorismate synthase [Polyangia bacterium]|jgi:menaquinone-specific isochorismate synthase|nr:isochorismate synthase [Polyangia bacterium]